LLSVGTFPFEPFIFKVFIEWTIGFYLFLTHGNAMECTEIWHCIYPSNCLLMSESFYTNIY